MIHILQLNVFKISFIENISFFHVNIKKYSIIKNYKKLKKQYLIFVMKSLINLYLSIEI